MVKDHSDSERGNPLPPHRLLFLISSKDNTYNSLCYTSCGALAGMRLIAQWVHHEGLIWQTIAPGANHLTLFYGKNHPFKYTVTIIWLTDMCIKNHEQMEISILLSITSNMAGDVLALVKSRQLGFNVYKLSKLL